MGNLHKAYVTFGKRPEALKKLLKTQDNDIAVFVELCNNGKWNASDIIEAATMSFDPLEQGFFAGIASSVAGAFSGAKYRRSFTILQHPDIGRVLATQDGMDEVFRASQPTGAIASVICWSALLEEGCFPMRVLHLNFLMLLLTYLQMMLLVFLHILERNQLL